MNITKAKLKHGSRGNNPPAFYCRKDWRKGDLYIHKKGYRDIANNIVRTFKGDIPNGNWYRKIFDLQYSII